MEEAILKRGNDSPRRESEDNQTVDPAAAHAPHTNKPAATEAARCTHGMRRNGLTNDKRVCMCVCVCVFARHTKQETFPATPLYQIKPARLSGSCREACRMSQSPTPSHQTPTRPLHTCTPAAQMPQAPSSAQALRSGQAPSHHLHRMPECAEHARELMRHGGGGGACVRACVSE